MWFKSWEITQNAALLKKASFLQSAAQVWVTCSVKAAFSLRLTTPEQNKKIPWFWFLRGFFVVGKPSHCKSFSKIQQKQTSGFLRLQPLLNHTIDHLPSFSHGMVCWRRPAAHVTQLQSPAVTASNSVPLSGPPITVLGGYHAFQGWRFCMGMEEGLCGAADACGDSAASPCHTWPSSGLAEDEGWASWLARQSSIGTASATGVSGVVTRNCRDRMRWHRYLDLRKPEKNPMVLLIPQSYC